MSSDQVAELEPACRYKVFTRRRYLEHLSLNSLIAMNDAAVADSKVEVMVQPASRGTEKHARSGSSG